jgi:hypothetical protein
MKRIELIGQRFARALLWQAGEINLHDAIDELQSAANADGLVAKLGQDEVQRLMAEAFAAVRDEVCTTVVQTHDADEDPLLEGLKFCADTKWHLEEWERRTGKTASQAPCEKSWSAPSWRDAAVEYHQDRGNSTLIAETEPACQARAHRLLADDVSQERAWADVSRPAPGAASTLMAAEYLVREGDRERLRKWFAAHGAEQRAAIFQHLERRRRRKAHAA